MKGDIGMKNGAPFACPKCGEEKGWKCLNDPTNNEMGNVARAVIQSAFGLLGVGIAKLFYRGKKLKYRCEKCGFEGSYKQD